MTSHVTEWHITNPKTGGEVGKNVAFLDNKKLTGVNIGLGTSLIPCGPECKRGLGEKKGEGAEGKN